MQNQLICYWNGINGTPCEMWDLTAYTHTLYDQSGNIISTTPCTPDQTTMLNAVKAAMQQADNRATLTQKAQSALTTNANFLALTAPTQAQTLSQVQTLTRESSAVIRLLLGLLDSLSGT